MSVEDGPGKFKQAKRIFIKGVLPAALVWASSGCDSISLKQQDITQTAVLAERCTSYLVLSAHYFRDQGGQENPDGSPKYEPGIDQLTGPAANRRYIVGNDVHFIPVMFIIGPDGSTNRVYAENGPEHLTEPKVPISGDSFADNQGVKVISISIRNTESKIKKDYQLPCDSTVAIDIKVPENQPNFDDFPEVEIKSPDVP